METVDAGLVRRDHIVGLSRCAGSRSFCTRRCAVNVEEKASSRLCAVLSLRREGDTPRLIVAVDKTCRHPICILRKVSVISINPTDSLASIAAMAIVREFGVREANVRQDVE